MPSVRVLASALGVLALAQLIVATQLTLDQHITHALLHAIAAWEHVRHAVYPPPPLPAMPVARTSPPAPLWSFADAADTPVGAPVVGANDTLYAATREALVALGPNGRERWRAPIASGGSLVEAPRLTARGDVAVAGHGRVTVHAPDGRVRWSWTTPERDLSFVHGLAAASGGGLFLVAESTGPFGRAARLVALDDAGRERWTFALGERRAGVLAPTPDDGVLVSIDGDVQRFDADGARERIGTSGDIRRAPNGDLHVVTASALTILSPTGAVRATVPVIADAPICNDSGSAVSTDRIVAFACGTRVYAVDSGGLRWSASVGEPVAAPPVFGPDGTLYVGADGVWAFDRAGRIRWHTATVFTWRDAETARVEAAAITASPVLGPDGTIYAGSGRNRVYALDADGGIRWVFPLGDDDSLVWRVARLARLDGALVVASHGLVALPIADGRLTSRRGENMQ